MYSKSFGFIGGGRVTRIILNALKEKKSMPERVTVSDANEEVLKKLFKEFPQLSVGQHNCDVAECDYIFISLHPPIITQVLEEIKGKLKPESIIISLAPKLSINKLNTLLGGNKKIVRMIPNAPSYINEGYNPVVFSSALTASEKNELYKIFELLGECPEVEESKLEAYAIITAMGPTYFWFQLRELIKLGESFGLTFDELKTGIKAMMQGSVNTMFESKLDITEVIDLIPVKPMAQYEKSIIESYHNSLGELYKKLTA